MADFDVSDDDGAGPISLADLVKPLQDREEYGALKKRVARVDAAEASLSGMKYFGSHCIWSHALSSSIACVRESAC